MSAPALFSDAPAGALTVPGLPLRVLDLLADGLSDAAIGKAVFVSESKVKDLLDEWADDLGTRDRAGMAAQGYLRGLLPGPYPVPDGRGRVSRQEHQALLLVAQGNTADRIAALWGLSTANVRGTLTRLRAELDARNRTHLIRCAVDAGVLTLVPKRGAR